MHDDETRDATPVGDVPRQLTAPNTRRFGAYVRSCRNERDLSPEALAGRSGLEVETIHELEAGAFSPSLDTLRRLCAGFDLELSVLLEDFDLRDSELLDLVGALSEDQYQALLQFLRATHDRCN